MLFFALEPRTLCAPEMISPDQLIQMHALGQSERRPGTLVAKAAKTVSESRTAPNSSADSGTGELLLILIVEAKPRDGCREEGVDSRYGRRRFVLRMKSPFQLRPHMDGQE